MTTTPAPGINPTALVGWILCGALLALGVAGIASIGLFVLLLTAPLLWFLLARRVPHARAGGLLGVGLLLGWVSWNLRWRSAAVCSGSSLSDGLADPCRSLVVPWGWLASAIAAVALGLAFLVRDVRDRRRVP